DILQGVPDIHFTHLTSEDVVRHKLVSEIVDAYGRYDAEQPQDRPAARNRGRR
ncbi:MAG: PhoH family protein, partial [Streptosporangiaceae bacterium]